MKKNIGVLGGGLSGLGIAYVLKKYPDFDITILEKEKIPGGLLRSVILNGYTFDVGGSHIIFSKNEKILNEMVSILGDNVEKKRRNTKILYKGHLVKYPFENGLGDLPLEDRYECLLYFVENMISQVQGKLSPPKNMKEWFYYTFGRGITEKYLIPYNEKIWKYPLEKMSTEWVERIPQPPLADVIKSALGIATEGYTHQLYFYYPRSGGIQALSDALARQQNVVTECIINKISRENSKWLVSTSKGEYYFDHLISTIPLPEFVKIYDIPAEIRNEISRLKHNSLITVCIGLDRAPFNDLSWLYIPDENILPHRISFPFNYSPEVTPPGKSSILAEVTYRNGEIANMSDEKISAKVIEDLESLNILRREEIAVVHTARFKYAYVLHDLEYRDAITKIEKFFNSEGIFLFGRFSQWAYINMDQVMAQAYETAEKVVKKAVNQ